MSAVLNRPQGAFDTTLTVYDSSGNVIAYNDDSFQDYGLDDHRPDLAATGTYYVMVTSSPSRSQLERAAHRCLRAVHVHFRHGHGDRPAGDSLYGGSGDDTIIAGSADDTIAAQLPRTRSSLARAP